MRVEPVELPSFTRGALSRTNTSGAPQAGRPCKIDSATALPAERRQRQHQRLGCLGLDQPDLAVAQSISSSRSETMSQQRSPVETASTTIA